MFHTTFFKRLFIDENKFRFLTRIPAAYLKLTLTMTTQANEL